MIEEIKKRVREIVADSLCLKQVNSEDSLPDILSKSKGDIDLVQSNIRSEFGIGAIEAEDVKLWKTVADIENYVDDRKAQILGI